VNRPGFDGDSLALMLLAGVGTARVSLARRGAPGKTGSRVEVSVGDRLVAVGAETAGPKATAEQSTVVAPADAEVALFAFGALVDHGGGRDGGPGRRGGAAVTGPPVGLLAGIRAVAAAPRSHEGHTAAQADPHLRIVTYRNVS